jgi:hypothetical protein
MRPRAFASLLAILVFAGAASADTIYSYTGNTLSVAYGSPSCGSACDITGRFTVADALSDNLNGAAITPESFSFSDGATTYSNGAGDSISISLSTGATGEITQWTIFVTPPGGPSVSSIGSGNALAGVEDTSFEPSYYLYNSGVPGSWSITETPESSTLLMLLLGLAMLGLTRPSPLKA